VSARGLCSGHCLHRGRRRTRGVVDLWLHLWHSNISNVTHRTPSPSHAQGVDTPSSLTLEATCELAAAGGTPATSPSCRSGGRATTARHHTCCDFFLSCSSDSITRRNSSKPDRIVVAPESIRPHRFSIHIGSCGDAAAPGRSVDGVFFVQAYMNYGSWAHKPKPKPVYSKTQNAKSACFHLL
jgi:hypothetical protein